MYIEQNVDRIAVSFGMDHGKHKMETEIPCYLSDAEQDAIGDLEGLNIRVIESLRANGQETFTISTHWDSMEADKFLHMDIRSRKEFESDVLGKLLPDLDSYMGTKIEEKDILDEMHSRNWLHDDIKAEQYEEPDPYYGLTPEQMAQMGMHPDGTPYESGPASEDPTEDEEDFMRAVDRLSGDGIALGE